MSIPRNSNNSKFIVETSYTPKGDQKKAIETISTGIENKQKYQNLIGATGTGKTYVMAKIIEKTQRAALVLAHNKTLAAQLYKEFKTFFPHNAVEYFVSYYDYYQPEAYVAKKDLYIEKDASINDEIDRLRLKATASLINRPDVLIVSSVSCIYGLGSAENYHEMYLTISVGKRLERDAFLRKLIEIQYSRNDQNLERSQFRVIGDVIDIIPSYMETAYRIELWGDEVERIVEIDPLNNTIIEEYQTIHIFPAKHFVTKQETIDAAIKNIKKELQQRIDFFAEKKIELEKHRIDSRTRYDLEMLSTVGYCNGIENYSRHLTGRKEGEPPDTLFDYFPENFIVFIDESHVTLPQIRGMFNGDRARKLSLVEHGFRLPSALDNRPLKFPEFIDKVKQMIFVSATPGDYELAHGAENNIEMINRPTGLIDPPIEVRSSEGQIDDLLAEIKKTIAQKYRILITTLTKKMAEKLSDYLQENNIKAVYLHSDIDTIERVEIIMSLRRGEIDVIVGINLLREGLDIPEVALVAILDADKIGFLRSQTSLIQTVGRAARNKDSRVIMYANRISQAMQGCIEETNRRRKIQLQYNKENNIKPLSISKKVDNILPNLEENKKNTTAKKNNSQTVQTAKINKMKKKDLQEKIKEIELLMKIAADQHDFEKAIFYRENLKLLKQKLN